MKRFLSWIVLFLLTLLLFVIISFVVSYIGLLYVKYGAKGVESMTKVIFGGTGVFGVMLCVAIGLCGAVVSLSQKIAASKKGVRYYVCCAVFCCYSLHSLYTLATGIFVTKYPLIPAAMYIIWIICAASVALYGRKESRRAEIK